MVCRYADGGAGKTESKIYLKKVYSVAYLFICQVGYDVLDGLSELRAKGQKVKTLRQNILMMP